ncbi:hypothetical protein U5A82_10280 [Sphingobium sp. CR2-8]|uniref:hypothetical protein n=1 Tax=Sphingobium sp. CR2-8 TaxID=1306534 RepID=UPI002DBF6EA0|nr:hypothetical protein [Sphingobium sp. CR2-8]MEC3910843.1 hypothetical protein [Sphingobium sp. CR2-8]
MNRKTTRPHPQRPVRGDNHVYLPHSSWARVDRKLTAATVIAPDDFWARLGL